MIWRKKNIYDVYKLKTTNEHLFQALKKTQPIQGLQLRCENYNFGKLGITLTNSIFIDIRT